MTALVPELLARAQALRGSGFTIVEAETWSFVAMQSKWHWDLATHVTTILRVRRAPHVTAEDARRGRHELASIGSRWDLSLLPRGFQHARMVVDVILADSVDDGARAFALGPIGKSFATGYHTALVSQSGNVVAASPIWGALFWPKISHAIRVVAQARAEPAPFSAGWLFFSLFFLYPGLALVGLMCCGIPLLVMPILLIGEREPKSLV